MTKLKIQSTKIDFVPRYCYLRVILDNRLRWRKHCEALRVKALNSLTAMKPLLRLPLYDCTYVNDIYFLNSSQAPITE